ncbi:hypothetical protein BGW80DRAFT_1348364 [Lactifluus volemus]|nr:hypothetical protein BGW80DRAFT_1348364 [Lactifluus volemus]
MEEYCLVVVGNKTDLLSGSDHTTSTTEEDALRLIDDLVPPSDTRSTSSPGNASGREIGYPPVSSMDPTTTKCAYIRTEI